MFIAIKPVDALSLSNSQITAITAYLKDYNVSTITPKIVTPIYIFIDHTIEVDYDVNQLKITQQQLKQNIINQIQLYYTENVATFSDGFHVSKLLPYIDGTDDSILGSSCDIGVVKEFSVPRFFDLDTTISMGDSIQTRGLESKTFTFNEIDEALSPQLQATFDLHVESTDSGFLVIGPFPPTSQAYVGELYNVNDFNSYDGTNKWYKIGQISYVLGTWSLDDFSDVSRNRFEIDSIDDDTIKFSASIDESDVYTQDGELIIFEPDLRPEYINITFNAVDK